MNNKTTFPEPNIDNDNEQNLGGSVTNHPTNNNEHNSMMESDVESYNNNNNDNITNDTNIIDNIIDYYNTIDKDNDNNDNDTTFTNNDIVNDFTINLKKCVYVVFDIETTGLHNY